MRRAPLLLVSILTAAACAAAPAPEAKQASPEPQATASVTAAPATPPEAPPAPSATAAPEAPPLPPAVKPLSVEEQKESQQKCKAVSAALDKRKKAGEKGTPLDLLEQVLAKPPAMGKDELDRCAGLMRRGIMSYMQAALETEAQMMVRRIAHNMATSYKGSSPQALCASAPPVPADLGAVRGKPYTSSAKDWSAPGWACLHFQLNGDQRFQYEVKTEGDGKRFAVLARAPSPDGGRVIEYRLRGTVDEGKGAVKLDEPERIERAP